MIKTSNLTSLENVDLSKEIGLVAITDTPFFSLLLQKGLVDTCNSTVATWREKTLDTTEDVSFAEGATTADFQNSARAEKTNILQIFKKGVEVSGTLNAISINGIPDLFASEVQDRLTEIKVNVEKALINGTRNDGSKTPFVRKMDGILSFATEANTITNTSLTLTKFKETVKALWENGLGINEYFAMVNADLKEEIDALYENKYSYIAQETLFGLIVRKIQTNYGNVNIVLNRHMADNKIVVFDPSYFRVSYLRKPTFEPLAKTGDSIKGQVLSELTLKCLNDKALAVFEKVEEQTP